MVRAGSWVPPPAKIPPLTSVPTNCTYRYPALSENFSVLPVFVFGLHFPAHRATPPCLRPGTMSGVSGILAPAEEAVIKGHIKDVLQAAFKGWGMDCDSAPPRRRLAFPVLVDTSATLHASLHSGKRPPGMTLPHLAVLAHACTPQAVGALGEL